TCALLGEPGRRKVDEYSSARRMQSVLGESPGNSALNLLDRPFCHTSNLNCPVFRGFHFPEEAALKLDLATFNPIKDASEKSVFGSFKLQLIGRCKGHFSQALIDGLGLNQSLEAMELK